LISCASAPKAIQCAPVKLKTVTVTQDRIVGVPSGMTQAVEKPYVVEESKDIIGLSAGYKARGVRIDQCNGRLDSIKDLAPAPLDEDTT